MLGTAGGAAGSGFSGPQGAQISNPVTQDQINTAYTNTQGAMGSQQALLQALQGQQGLQNQSNVYNQLQGVVAGTGPNPAQAQLAQATGANTANQAALMAGQRGASQNVGMIARQAAQQGAANQQQAAGQAATMQANQSLNALGQAGQMAGTMASNQIGQTNANTQAQQAEQQAILNAQQAYNANQVGMQSNINNVNGQLANTQIQGQQALLGGMMNSAGSGVSSMMAKGGKVQSFDDGGSVDEAPPTPNFGNYQDPSTSVSVNTSTPSFGSDAGASALAKGASSMGGSSGGGSGGGGLMSLMALMALGGEVKKMYADPTQPVSATDSVPTTQPDASAPKSKFGQFLKGASKQTATPNSATPSYGNAGANALYQGMSSLGKGMMGGSQQVQNYPGQRGSADQDEQYVGANAELGSGGDTEKDMPAANTDQPTPIDQNGDYNAAEGGRVPAMVSPGEVYLPPDKVKEVKKGRDPIKTGEKIPGKPKFKGNDYRNDTVPKTLEEGGIVIPNEVLQKKNPHWEAMRFVHATLAKSRHGKKK